MRRVFSCLLGSLTIGGCTIIPDGSWVSGVEPQDGTVLARDMAAYIGTALPPGKSTIVLLPDNGPQPGIVEPLLDQDLRRMGYAIAEAGSDAPDAIPVRLLVESEPAGTTLRLNIAQGEVTRVFRRNTAGSLQPAGPYVVRSEKNQS